MGETTGILWTDHTFNPWIGCTKVSAGCTHCYAEARDIRFEGGHWGKGAPRQRTTIANWKQPLRWNRDGMNETRRPRVFCASLADVFDVEVPDHWRLELFDVIRRTPALDWQLLTKRPEHIPRLIQGAIDAFIRAADANTETVDMLQRWLDGKPPRNVWLGTSVEDQAAADKRIPLLLEVPARVRFLSLEPLLGPVDFNRCPAWNPAEHGLYLEGIHWAIIGGESGHGARPFDLAWARLLRDQCASAGVACFVKQLGAKAESISDHLSYRGSPTAKPDGFYRHLNDSKGGDWAEWPADLRVREFPEAKP